MKRLLKQTFKGPEVFYNGATTFLDFMDFIQVVGLSADNLRPDISYSDAMDFLDQVEEEHGDTYLYDMVVFASGGYSEFDDSVDKADLARAISGW